MLALVEDPAVDLVGQDHEVVLAGDVGDLLEVLARRDAAGRVGRRVDDDELGPRRDQRRQLVRVEAEVVLLADRAGDGLAADEAGHRLVDREARVRVDDLVALVDEGQDREEHDRLAAGDHDHAVRRRR